MMQLRHWARTKKAVVLLAVVCVMVLGQSLLLLSLGEHHLPVPSFDNFRSSFVVHQNNDRDNHINDNQQQQQQQQQQEDAPREAALPRPTFGNSTVPSAALQQQQQQQLQQHDAPSFTATNRKAAVDGSTSIVTTRPRRLPLPSAEMTPLDQFHWILLPQLDGQKQDTQKQDSLIPIQKHYSRLSLVHIPKTGGSTLEALARAHHVSWSYCLFSAYRDANCPPTTHLGKNMVPWPFSKVPLWHLPVPLLPTFVRRPYEQEERKQWENARRKKRKKKKKKKQQNKDKDNKHQKDDDDEIPPPPPMQAWPNPYQDHDLLILVRNPYQRAVSEYYYQCSFLPKTCNFIGEDRSTDTAERLNRQLQVFLNVSLQAIVGLEDDGDNNDVHDNYRYSLNYRNMQGHWIPQADYWLEHFPIVDEFATTNRSGSGTIAYQPQQHYVHLEHLARDLPPLLQAYGYHNWTDHTSNFLEQYRRRPTAAKHSVVDLTDDTIAMIERVYNADFSLFGYPRLSDYPNVLESLRRDLSSSPK